MTATTKQEFISTIESFDYPIYGSQFHPEVVPFDWLSDSKINHKFEDIQMSQFLANFFVGESRKNFHSFSSEEEENKYLIYNYSPVKAEDFWE